MGTLKLDAPKLWCDVSMQETARRDLRPSRRVNIGQPVRLIPSIARGELFAEVGTSNVSREGFYFLTEREHYQEGVRLLVTLSYHCPRERGDHGYPAQVVRVQLLPDGLHGIAVELLTSIGGLQ